MKTIGTYHIPALLEKTIELLNVRFGKIYIDATLGGGGHSEEIVKAGGVLLGIDRDPEAIAFASERLSHACPGTYQTVHPSAGCQTVPGNFRPPVFVKGNFADIDKIAKENGFEKVDGILFDLGVSSHQLEKPDRGFSFNQGGLLDMRMDPDLPVKASDLIAGLNEGELVQLFWKLGEEKFAKKYAKAICKARMISPIQTCNQLSEVILSQAPKRGRFDRTHPATRVFQALRIAVNDELNCLREALPKSLRILNLGGRLVVLSFHSLEDAIVKKFFLEQEKNKLIKIINQKPIVPTPSEIEENPRVRSAKLRAAEKL